MPFSSADNPVEQATTFWDQFTAFWTSWTLWSNVIQIVLIIVVAVIVRLLALWVIRLFVNQVVSGAKKRQGVQNTQALMLSPIATARTVQRTRTLGTVLNNIVTTVIVIVAVISIVAVLNTQITGAFALITAALGAGLGFGAQNIVKDVLAGLFMVAEDQAGVGDVIETDLASGVVEAVGIRVSQVRDVNGVLWFIRNGELTRIGNHSQGWSRAVVDVTVPQDADPHRVQERLYEAMSELLADPKWAPHVIGRVELWGLESITADGVVIRITARTTANAQDDVSWAMRVHTKDLLDELGIVSPSLTSTPIAGYEYVGSLRGTRPGRTATAPTKTRRAPIRRAKQAPAADVGPESAAGRDAASAPEAASAEHGRTGARGETGETGRTGATETGSET